MTRWRSIVLLSACCGLLAGCGASASGPPQYVAAGDAICTAQLAQLQRLPQPTTPEQAVSYLPHAIAMIQRETGALAALDPGAPERAQLAAAILSSHQLAALLTGFLHQLRTQIVEFTTFAQVQAQSSALRAEIDAHFRRAGLPRCAS